MSDRDTSFNQSRDGFNVFEPTPFLPSFGSKFDKTDDDFGVSLDLTGYSVDFNQGYIFNSVSSGQVSPDYITIGNMTGHVLPLEHDNHYYVEVKLNAQNFKVNCATLTGVSNNSTGDLTNSFPHVKFDQYDAGVIEFTGYYPILRLQNGDLTEFHQRGDIVLSDRQFKQKGSFVEGTSAHVLVAENRKDDNFPVRVRAILGRSGITVTQNEDYIVLDAEAASGSGGDTGAKNIGVDSKSLTFKIGRNSKSISHIKIYHNMMDLYDVEFIRVRGTSMKVVKKVNDVYAEDLQNIFSKYTGMATRF